MRINRFVLDTNIWISYLITGTEHILVDIIEENELIVFSCKELLEEITGVLGYAHLQRFKVNINIALRTIRSVTTQFPLTYPIKKYIPADPKDDYLIALALQTNSGFITSGDQHILSQKIQLEEKYKKLKVLTKAEFEDRFLSS